MRTVARHQIGQRLDRFLREAFPSHGRRVIRRWLAEGAVQVNGRPGVAGNRLASGDTVCVDPRVVPAIAPEPEAPLHVVLERPNLVVLNKPPGQPTAPLHPGERGTLCGALLARFPEMQSVGYRPREPGILHRLDTGTSGVLVAARTTSTFERLRAALTAGELHKLYLALVPERGLPDEWVVRHSLEPGPRGSVRVAAPGHGAPAMSRVRVRVRRPPWALVEVEAPRAYRHQVRVHLAASGCPLVGDRQYGGVPHPALRRHALHAQSVAWPGDPPHPGFSVRVDPPSDMQAVLASRPLA